MLMLRGAQMPAFFIIVQLLEIVYSYPNRHRPRINAPSETTDIL